jgi:hypothetical protein
MSVGAGAVLRVALYGIAAGVIVALAATRFLALPILRRSRR